MDQDDAALRAGQLVCDAAGFDGIVAQAVVVVEVHRPDGDVTFHAESSSQLPWVGEGLLRYALRQWPTLEGDA